MRFFYYPICPISNKFRILLNLLRLDFEEVKIISRQDVKILPQINFQYLPILQSGDKFFRDSNSIMIFLSNISSDKLILDWLQNEEIQYMEIFFDKYMFFDLYKPAIFEKTEKLILFNEYFPNNDVIKKGLSYQEEYLSKLEAILWKNNWINKIHSVNDISCFSMLAVLDYCFMIPWMKFPNLKQWYQKLKSREEYNFVLKERIYNFLPPKHYDLIDF
jgi:glutathione S-transferase